MFLVSRGHILGPVSWKKYFILKLCFVHAIKMTILDQDIHSNEVKMTCRAPTKIKCWSQNI